VLPQNAPAHEHQLRAAGTGVQSGAGQRRRLPEAAATRVGVGERPRHQHFAERAPGAVGIVGRDAAKIRVDVAPRLRRQRRERSGDERQTAAWLHEDPRPRHVDRKRETAQRAMQHVLGQLAAETFARGVPARARDRAHADSGGDRRFGPFDDEPIRCGEIASNASRRGWRVHFRRRRFELLRVLFEIE
jgi:hypothetical protein